MRPRRRRRRRRAAASRHRPRANCAAPRASPSSARPRPTSSRPARRTPPAGSGRGSCPRSSWRRRRPGHARECSWSNHSAPVKRRCPHVVGHRSVALRDGLCHRAQSVFRSNRSGTLRAAKRPSTEGSLRDPMLPVVARGSGPSRPSLNRQKLPFGHHCVAIQVAFLPLLLRASKKIIASIGSLPRIGGSPIPIGYFDPKEEEV